MQPGDGPQPDRIGTTRDAKRGRELALGRRPDPPATLPGGSIPPIRSFLFNVISSRLGRGPEKIRPGRISSPDCRARESIGF